MEARDLPTVSVRTLSREPGQVLDRVRKGERMILCRHGRPVGTLQPLNGFVMQPIEGRAHDLLGSPLLFPHQEIEKLSPVERRLLTDCVWRDVVKTSRLPDSEFASGLGQLGELELKGLARRTDRGLVLTARGFVIREALYERRGEIDPRYQR